MVQLLLSVIYLSFISLGLPDSMLGASWPALHADLGVPVSYAGIVSVIIAVGTIVSSLLSDRLTKWLGTGRVTAISVAMTAAALLGFSAGGSIWLLCLWAIPYGLGAGSVDASLNNYVALHYESRHMSWLHCMWGIGASLGPSIMGYALTGGHGWQAGYRAVGLLQAGLTGILLLSLPLWKKRAGEGATGGGAREKALTLRQIAAIPGAKEIMLTFFCYCAIEATIGLWASSYLALHRGLSEDAAAGFASLYFIGITVGRALSGFLTIKFSDTRMIRMGQAVLLLGALLLLLPMGGALSFSGLLLMGLGSAPIYPCIIHSTPTLFGAERSQAVIGVQMASAYTGSCLMPPLFGLIASWLHASLFPLYLLLLLLLMAIMHEMVLKRSIPAHEHTKPS